MARLLALALTSWRPLRALPRQRVLKTGRAHVLKLIKQVLVALVLVEPLKATVLLLTSISLCVPADAT